ncbi:formimidoylglutamate deiminase [Tropicimonas sp. IMCC6043]|uniref:formimidoylglutamate deiminase n=1 Tax=Tropicimonas sp. IMCC6043 TaxID=2510645 RepID=UPI00101DB846|nr:formimidoylglutamate deiminase [Tropicimonas sp. IMCC6043]RYH12262.1 formimidoylglutamate deiminase [Tropicimonas sp. IMCC6043]
MAIFAKTALLPEGWAQDVRIEIADGRIGTLRIDTQPAPDDARVDRLLPALSNLHSHTFQRAMAGMTEYRAHSRDSFWSWRELMYRFVDRLTPDQVEAIAAQAFVEMQEAGFAAVGEFHYVHHQPHGTPYDDMAELSLRIFSAAAETGIGLTHLPVLYSYGGVSKAALSGGQLRFGTTPEHYLRLVEKARPGLTALPEDARLGIAPHSLRATCPEDLARVLQAHGGGPVHIHVAEQLREVTEVEGWLGARPVEWLLDHADVGPDWCLVHATHMTDRETRAVAESGAVAGLCPITEANLGDGPFNGPAYLEAGGVFGVGSDSNVQISLTGELRMLEYSQRLRDMARNVLVRDGKSVGETLYTGAARGGAQALGRDAGEIRVGALADLVAIDGTAATLCGLTDRSLIDGFVFAASDTVVTDLWSAGRHRVRGGRHVAREAIEARFRHAMTKLTADL